MRFGARDFFLFYEKEFCIEWSSRAAILAAAAAKLRARWDCRRPFLIPGRSGLEGRAPLKVLFLDLMGRAVTMRPAGAGLFG